MPPFLLLPIKPLQIGLLHPLLVHLPIGIVFFALLLSLMPKTFRNSLQQAQSLSILAAAISSIVASITGYLLAQSGDYDSSAVTQHQWAGIVTATIMLLAFFIKQFQRILIWIAALSIAITGHWGGELTHGEGYLDKIFASSSEEKLAPNELDAATNDAVFKAADTNSITEKYSPYQTAIAPILKANCYTCHSSTKKKGGLRLDSEKWIKAGGKKGLILTGGSPEKSTLYTHLKLPLEDELHMPPKGKRQLNNGAINTIFHWIQMGAPFGEIERGPTAASVQTETMDQPEEPIKMQDMPVAAVLINESLIGPADPEMIRSLTDREVIVKPIANRANGLYVNLVNIKSATPEITSLLGILADQVVELKMNDVTLMDGSLSFLAGFKNLTHLHLSQTNIQDSSMVSVSSLNQLRYLNLYGTPVTDQSLGLIVKLPNIRKVNLWNTGVTTEAILQFSRQHPEITLEYGQLKLNHQDSLQKQ
ncbi:MAG: hypothetical protein RLZZ557_1990 [Bacteroidota bacterium]